MKDALKALGLLLVGLATAAILFPSIHEGGHAIVALLVGAKVMDFSLYPLPYVACDVTSVGQIAQIAIGFGGIFVPYILSLLIRSSRFWIWYALMLIKVINIYALIISLVSVVLSEYGIYIQNEDMVQILAICPDVKLITFIAFLIMILIEIFIIIKEQPIYKCLKYFEVVE